ncbi:MAG: glycoside hydrolase family 2 protein [Burkholderiales bacterium]
MNRPTQRAPGERRTPLVARWQLRRVPAGTLATPTLVRAAPAEGWLDIPAADTVASALRALGHWSLDATAQNFDADDWWFRARFDAPTPHASRVARDLRFGGLAGLCEVWLNGATLLVSRNMHLAHRCAEPALQASDNELLMRFASLDQALAQRRSRPRWRAPMVAHQQLRWQRTTLLGRTPGWSPPAAAVGPWRAIEWVEAAPQIEASHVRLRSRVEGTSGVLELAVDLAPSHASARIERAELLLTRDGSTHRSELIRNPHSAAGFTATLALPDAALWWPHTHGEPALYDASLRVQAGGAPVELDLGRIGFRTLALDTQNGDFALRVNGVPVFCRGACWTPLDVVSLKATPAATRTALEQARDAGMNMLRVSGSMVYEDTPFFDACDALGLLVWQDFMFANMDYPNEDADFAASVRDEVTQQLERWQARPCLAVLCGNSEAEQQAAMWGAPRANWSQPLFDRDIAELAGSWCPDVPYWPSSAHGGAFPHQNNTGTTAYYGVGAYRRPLDDARRAGLRFATECLGFANLPSAATLARLPGGWQARTPRDLGADWDFDDVRDHYLQQLYGVDPAALRRSDPDRYLAMGRAVSAEVMGASFAEWRRAGSGCRGALVWFLRDLWAGAGWGVLDDQGAAKAAFHGLRRALAPIAMFISDEGTNGLDLQLVNDPGCDLVASVEIALYRDDALLMQRAAQTHSVPAHGALTLPIAQWFDDFVDLSRAYRFGPTEYALVVATLRDAAGDALTQAFHLCEGLAAQRERDVGLSAQASQLADGQVELTIATLGFAQSLHFDLPGFVADDEYFHLAPGAERCVRFTPIAGNAPTLLAGTVRALNTRDAVSVRIA